MGLSYFNIGNTGWKLLNYSGNATVASRGFLDAVTSGCRGNVRMGATIPVSSRSAEWSTNPGVVAMRRQTRIRLYGVRVAAICSARLHSEAHTSDLFAWWLDPWLQRRANQSLWDDVQANLYFLSTKGQPIEEKRTQVLRFDYGN